VASQNTFGPHRVDSFRGKEEEGDRERERDEISLSKRKGKCTLARHVGLAEPESPVIN